ncbi:tat pathway signal sequence [Diplodia corticola]|uniref:Tat pathway signal sequence n=1 Tax=Diplodia corticola TaxID=236234 RepID=A0A1J9S638_9PEZI|nr:tat pathway signal sequence [Diplodia corticola]OJD35077.1 tat pathway signal sequence [Diplodia corticola]
MRLSTCWLAALLSAGVLAQGSDDSDKSSSASGSGSSANTVVLTGTNTKPSVSVPTGTYISYSSTVRVSTGDDDGSAGTKTKTGTAGASSEASISEEKTVTVKTQHTITLLTGADGTRTYTGGPLTPTPGNSTASETSSSAAPTNTQPCNGYTELCSRKYSNVTEVCAHNSPFTIKNNAASNQNYDVTTQLNDGIRMLQAQAHYNGTGKFNLCHTSCDILNAGTLVDYLKEVASWVQQHPYDIVTILIGNADYATATNFTTPIEDSGLKAYAYEPPVIPMGVEDWPTYTEMILTSKRVVFFLDYQANQTAVPYLMDEFSQLWETPFDPTDQAFPCTVQRPPDLPQDQAKNRMYMINHNLNADISILGNSILVPNKVNLTLTNANTTEYGALGLSVDQCTDMWGRPPNRLNVDYYNIGNINGSVFAAAADANNVTYNGKCCGLDSTSDAVTDSAARPLLALAISVFVGVAVL